jgi:hypothetical protein
MTGVASRGDRVAGNCDDGTADVFENPWKLVLVLVLVVSSSAKPGLRGRLGTSSDPYARRKLSFGA